jgi:hypothetical protein
VGSELDARRTGSPKGSRGWRGAWAWGRNLLPSGPVTGGESHPSPSRLQAGWQLLGAESDRQWS